MGFKITRKAMKVSPDAQVPPERTTGVLGVLQRHVKFLGPGIVASAAYYDPGNWATDLQAGSRFGNAHLFILLIAIFIAVFLQILATRVGFISRKDIAQNCRASLDSGKGQVARRWILLYPLWVLFELGILFADMGELLGSATALILLFPRIPPWVAVLLTFPEVFLALLFFRNGKQSKKSIQIFEIMITVVVMTVVVSALVLFFKVKPNFVKLLRGYIPSSTLITGSSFYTAIGILGATVGPHSLFLGANMATRDRQSDELTEKKLPSEATMINLRQPQADAEKQPEYLHTVTSGDREAAPFDSKTVPKERSVLECTSYLAHASFDIAASIFTLPLIVNSAILVVASTTFFYNKPANQAVEEADLPAMHALLKNNLGPGFAVLFAVSLWLSGNAASLTITMAGQSLSAGFLNYQTSPLIRRLITRTLGIIPAVIISGISAQKGINDLLVATQVAISIVLPFAVIPLAYFSSKNSVMSIAIPPKIGRLFTEDEINVVKKYRTKGAVIPRREPSESQLSDHLKALEEAKMKEFKISNPDSLHSFANHWIVIVIAVTIIVVVLASNMYGIYQVASGN